MIPSWAIATMLKYFCADFCLQCQVFVLTKGEHCVGTFHSHSVVRLQGGR